MGSRSSSVVAAALALWALGAPREARAHDFSPGVLALEEVGDGVFEVAWTEPVDTTGAPGGVSVEYPPSCRFEGEEAIRGLLRCDRSLEGDVTFTGMHTARTQVVVSVRYRDGSTFERVADGSSPKVAIRSGASSFGAWITVGISHVLTGFDHLAFLLGLLLVTGPMATRAERKNVLLAITAFTLGHSLSLALAIANLVALPRDPVEATIALSVVFVAKEALHGQPTLSRTHPWVVAGLFGLIHGLGFASALRELQLPSAVAVPLVGFNLGVELAQLAVVAVYAGVTLAVRHSKIPAQKVHRVASYAVGALGAMWFIERCVSMGR
jgi:hypothetical protein